MMSSTTPSVKNSCLGFAGQIGEGENGDGRLLRQREPRFLHAAQRVPRCLIKFNAEDTPVGRCSSVGAFRDLGSVHLPGNLIVNFRRNTDPVRLGDAFQTRSDIDPVAVDSGFVMDDIALVDTDPELNLSRPFDLALPRSRLDCDRAFDGVHDTPKLSEDPVARRIDDPATRASQSSGG